MKKLFILALATGLAVPVLAGDTAEGKDCPHKMHGPRPEMMQQDPASKEKMEAKKAEFKAQKEKMEVLDKELKEAVKKYKKAKPGSKEQVAAKEKITQILNEMHDEQIAFREKQILGFKERLKDIEARVEEEKTPDAKAAWVDQMADKVIEKDGDLKAVFAKEARMGKGPKKMHGPKGPHGKHPGMKGGRHEDHILPMPPAPKEEK